MLKCDKPPTRLSICVTSQKLGNKKREMNKQTMMRKKLAAGKRE
jgi:hypothetical protein